MGTIPPTSPRLPGMPAPPPNRSDAKVTSLAMAIILGVGLAIVLGILLLFAYLDEQMVRTPARVLLNGSTPGGLFGGSTWTLVELPNGRRLQLAGAFGVPGENVTVRVNRMWLEER